MEIVGIKSSLSADSHKEGHHRQNLDQRKPVFPVSYFHFVQFAYFVVYEFGVPRAYHVLYGGAVVFCSSPPEYTPTLARISP